MKNVFAVMRPWSKEIPHAIGIAIGVTAGAVITACFAGGVLLVKATELVARPRSAAYDEQVVLDAAEEEYGNEWQRGVA